MTTVIPCKETGTTLSAPLHCFSASDLDRAGGKAANLGELVRAGFPVPPGFALTTAAYDRFVEQNSLRETIAKALSEESGSGTAIRNAFESAPVSEDLQREILAAYHHLGRPAVAVRSSATAEDMPEAAFAGQQDTFLNVVGEEALLEAVRKCWASLWTDRAIAYRERQGIDQAHVKLAVVVQSMVEADVAGVLFTANPVTGARNESVIDSSPGLGEAVVSGQVTPDQYLLRKRWLGWSIVERRAGRREVIIRAQSGGGTEHVTGQAMNGEPVIRDRALRKLARLGEAIERHFGRPQDVEWAWAGGEVFILQARPITALPEPPPHWNRPVQMWAGIVSELMPSRPYPLEFTTWGLKLMFTALLAPMFRLMGLRVNLNWSIVEEDGVVIRFTDRLPFRPTANILLAPLQLLRLTRRYDPSQWHEDPLLEQAQTLVEKLEERDLESLSWRRLLETVHEALTVPMLIGEIRIRYLLPIVPAIIRLRLMLALLGAGDRFGTLFLTGLETKTIEANRALEDLAERIGTDPDLAGLFKRYEAGELWDILQAEPRGQDFLNELRSFLDQYGHREVGGTLQVSQSTWKQEPQVVLGILKGLASTPPKSGTEKLAWEEARDELLSHPILQIPPIQRAFHRTLAQARRFPTIRENTRFYATWILPVLHRTLLELGNRLVEADVLKLPEDVFHLKFGELERIEVKFPIPEQEVRELRSLVARRKVKRVELEGTPLVDPRLLRSPGGESDALLLGTPGSPGVVEAPVRIIRDSSEFGKLRSGDVLVAPFTNPAWTPLFQRASAVVVDTGGPGSHAAIVAREYGIPAVMGTVNGTQTLHDGERIRVDGSRGAVFRADL